MHNAVFDGCVTKRNTVPVRMGVATVCAGVDFHQVSRVVQGSLSSDGLKIGIDQSKSCPDSLSLQDTTQSGKVHPPSLMDTAEGVP